MERINMPKIRKTKTRLLSEIYARSAPVAEHEAPRCLEPQPEVSEQLALMLEEPNCPTLSPPRLEENLVEPEAPLSPESSSEDEDRSSVFAQFSDSTEEQIDYLQGRIEEEVARLANESGYGLLYEDAPHVLGQWVHNEDSRPDRLLTILSDLSEHGSGSIYFKDAVDALGEQFIVRPQSQSPVETFYFYGDWLFSLTNSSLSMLLTLGLVLLLLFFVTKKGRGKRSCHDRKQK